jgi:hypothetical protein
MWVSIGQAIIGFRHWVFLRPIKRTHEEIDLLEVNEDAPRGACSRQRKVGHSSFG